MEKPKLPETARQLLVPAAKIGQFALAVIDRLEGGQFGKTAERMNVPVKAHITYFGTGEIK